MEKVKIMIMSLSDAVLHGKICYEILIPCTGGFLLLPNLFFLDLACVMSRLSEDTMLV